MAVTLSPIHSTKPTVAMTPPESGPLWRFALVGLGPLAALGILALLAAVSHRLA